MNTLARNVVPFRRPQAPQAKPRQHAVFSADPRHAGLRFARSTSEAFHDAEYAGWLYHYRPTLWRRIVRAVRELTS